MKKLALAFVYSALLNVLYYLVLPVVSGVLLTWLYVPDVVFAYDSVEYLQNEVVFGQINDSSFAWWQSLPLTLAVGMVISLAFMSITQRFRQKRA